MSHSLCVIGVYDEVKMMVPMIVTVLTGKTPDSAVMTTRAGKYH
jgi:hypothetical protein